MTAKSDSTLGSMAHKRCFRCHEEKPASSFHKHKSTRDGLQAACIACAKESRKPVDKERAASFAAKRSKALDTGVKPCSKCGCEKPLSGEFWALSARGLGGFDSKCKTCQALERQSRLDPAKLWKRADELELSEVGMKRCPACMEARPIGQFIPRSCGGVYSYCLECCKKKSRAARDKDILKDRQKKLASYHRRRQVVGDLMRSKRNHWRSSKRKDDPVFSLSERVRGLLGSAMRRMGYTKKAKTQTILGCDWHVFAAHIERQFLRGMNWANRQDWHLDHIVPLATAKTEEDVIRLNHFTNLRPIWAKDNLSKGAQITHLI